MLFRRIAVVCLSLGLTVAALSESKAGPLTDWLYGPRTVYSNPNVVAPVGPAATYYATGPRTIYPPATPPFPSGPRYYTAPLTAPVVVGQTANYPPLAVAPQATTAVPGQTSYYGNPQTLPAAGGQTVYYGNSQTLPATGGQTVYYGNPQTFPATGGQTVYYGNPQTVPSVGGQTVYYGGAQAAPVVNGQVPYSYPAARPVFPWLYRLRNSIGNWSPLRPFDNRTTVGYPYTAAYPGVTAYRPVIAQSQAAPIVTGRVVYSNPQAVQVYSGGGAAMGDPCAAPVYQQPVVQYMPSTQYRTRLLKVPVTYYRPVSTVDPATGVPVTYMAPCTSNTWQVRRVPHTTFSPVMSSVAVVGASAWPTMQPVDCGPCPTSMPATTIPASEPYYSPPSNYVPGSPMPMGTSSGSTFGSEPADYPPDLNSNVLRVTPQAMSQSATPRALEPLGSSADGPTAKGDSADSAHAAASDAAADANTTRPDPSAFDRLRIRLVPDPEAPPIPTRRDTNAPPIPAARHKTAYQPTRLATGYAPVSWPAPNAASISVDAPARRVSAPANDAVAPASTRDTHRWDDTGWRSLDAR
jgi:hypothetical protein